ncbi:MAG: UDP-N-acetylmuramate dehydrogenase [Wolinella sp.]
MQKLIDFSRYTSIRIGAPVLVQVLEDIALADSRIIGHGYNLLVSPNAGNLAVLGERFAEITQEGEMLKVGAATKTSKLFSYAKSKNLSGFEMLSSLPGSVGGIVKMNAGMKGHEIKDVLVGIITARGFIPVHELILGYRSSNIDETIFYAIFRAIPGFRESLVKECRAMRRNQPKGASFGSVFKNPSGDYAGRMLEAVGLKGFRHGGVGFSEVHANFMINHGGATFSEAIWLINEAKRRVSEEFGVALVPEVAIIE